MFKWLDWHKKRRLGQCSYCQGKGVTREDNGDFLGDSPVFYPYTCEDCNGFGALLRVRVHWDFIPAFHVIKYRPRGT